MNSKEKLGIYVPTKRSFLPPPKRTKIGSKSLEEVSLPVATFVETMAKLVKNSGEQGGES